LGIKAQRKLVDGTSVYYTQNKIPLRDDDGNITGILGVSWDDTELREAQKSIEEKQRQLEAISELSRTTVSDLDLDSMLEQTVNLIQQKFNLYHAAIYMIDPLHEFAIYRVGTGEAGKKHKEDGYRVSLQGTIFGKVFNTRESHSIPDINQDESFIRNPLLPNAKSVLNIPLRVGSEVLGIIDFEKDTISGFSTQDTDLLNIIADQLAVAISNASQSGKLQDYLLRQRSLYLITSNATAASDVSQALQIVVDGLYTSLPKSQIMLFAPDKNGILIVAAQRGYENLDITQIKVSQGEGIVGEVAANKKQSGSKTLQLIRGSYLLTRMSGPRFASPSFTAMTCWVCLILNPRMFVLLMKTMQKSSLHWVTHWVRLLQTSVWFLKSALRCNGKPNFMKSPTRSIMPLISIRFLKYQRPKLEML